MHGIFGDFLELVGIFGHILGVIFPRTSDLLLYQHCIGPDSPMWMWTVSVSVPTRKVPLREDKTQSNSDTGLDNIVLIAWLPLLPLLLLTVNVKITICDS